MHGLYKKKWEKICITDIVTKNKILQNKAIDCQHTSAYKLSMLGFVRTGKSLLGL